MKITHLQAFAMIALVASIAAPPRGTRCAEPPADGGASASFGERRTAVVDSMEGSIWIDAAPQAVWDCAVKDFDGWWPHCYKANSHCRIEPWAGGRIWERFDEADHGAIYGHVLYLEEPIVMKADGQWGMPGTAVSGGTWRFEPKDGGTLFRMKGEVMGGFAAEAGFDGRREAYLDIMQRLKHFVETGERIDRAAELEAAAEQAAKTEAGAAQEQGNGG